MNRETSVRVYGAIRECICFIMELYMMANGRMIRGMEQAHWSMLVVIHMWASGATTCEMERVILLVNNVAYV